MNGASPPLPLTVIGGYLGAGKTTLINSLLRRRAGRRYAVLVNDFGELNIDAALIESEADDTIALTNGCVCCAIGDDLGAALLRLMTHPVGFDEVLLEASGVADPLKLGRMANIWPGYTLKRVAVVVDAQRTRDLCADPFVGKHVRQQLADADVLLLSKLDRLTPAAGSAFQQWLHVHSTAPSLAADQWQLNEDPPQRERAAATPGQDAHPTFFTRRYRTTQPIDRNAFLRWAGQQSGTRLRAKGFVAFADNTVRETVQLVDGQLALSSAPRNSRTSELILIAQDPSLLRNPFAQLQEPAVSPP